MSLLRPHLGELLDRESILILKVRSAKQPRQLAQFAEELQEISIQVQRHEAKMPRRQEDLDMCAELAAVNRELWESQAQQDPIVRALNQRRAELILALGRLEDPELAAEKV